MTSNGTDSACAKKVEQAEEMTRYAGLYERWSERRAVALYREAKRSGDVLAAIRKVNRAGNQERLHQELAAKAHLPTSPTRVDKNVCLQRADMARDRAKKLTDRSNQVLNENSEWHEIAELVSKRLREVARAWEKVAKEWEEIVAECYAS